MISFMVPIKPDCSGLVLSTLNLSYNSEFVHLPSWYRPLVSNKWPLFKDEGSKCCTVHFSENLSKTVPDIVQKNSVL